MIYTVTLNPSIDYVMTLDQLTQGAVNRANQAVVYPGGKGINVSQVLVEHHVKTVALGFVSGFTGEFITQALSEKQIQTAFITLPHGMSRINVKLNSSEETEINGQGPMINEEAIESLYEQLEQLKPGDSLVLGGSIPSSLPETFYQLIMQRVNTKGIDIIVDTTKQALLSTLVLKPFLIKPNQDELAELFESSINSQDQVIAYGKKLQALGARNVLVSRGKEGAILLTETGEILSSNVPKGVVKNAVGAGDSMVAGFIAGYLDTHSFEHALKLGVASGSATAFSSDLAKQSLINELFPKITIKRVIT